MHGLKLYGVSGRRKKKGSLCKYTIYNRLAIDRKPSNRIIRLTSIIELCAANRTLTAKTSMCTDGPEVVAAEMEEYEQRLMDISYETRNKM